MTVAIVCWMIQQTTLRISPTKFNKCIMSWKFFTQIQWLWIVDPRTFFVHWRSTNHEPNVAIQRLTISDVYPERSPSRNVWPISTFPNSGPRVKSKVICFNTKSRQSPPDPPIDQPANKPVNQPTKNVQHVDIQHEVCAQFSNSSFLRRLHKDLLANNQQSIAFLWWCL